jgi:hypothetical protein
MALDSATEDVAAVETAVALAARLRAELLGLFVEDIDLVRLAEHPELRTFSTLSTNRPSLVADHLKRALRAQLARSRQAMEQAAQRRRIRCTFEVRRGRLMAEVLTAAGAADLVIVGWSGGVSASLLTGGREGALAAASALAEEAPHSVLLLRPGPSAEGPLLLAYDGSASARQALAAAIEIAGEDGGCIEAALLADRLDRAEALRREVEQALAAVPVQIRFVHLPKADADAIYMWAGKRQGSLMVLGAALPVLEGEALRRLLERVPCSLLLVR